MDSVAGNCLPGLPVFVFVWRSYPDSIREPVAGGVLRASAHVGVGIVAVHHVPVHRPGPTIVTQVQLASMSTTCCSTGTFSIAADACCSPTPALWFASPVQKAVPEISKAAVIVLPFGKAHELSSAFVPSDSEMTCPWAKYHRPVYFFIMVYSRFAGA